ncbi:MAG: hypothetical protein KGV59_01590 [Tenacibaculum sp.]|nr:hypothetical protein [Tenacibaculum sp.]
MRLTKEIKEFLSVDLNKSRFCVEIGVSRNTLLSRIASPETFKAIEIKKLKELSKVKKIFE